MQKESNPSASLGRLQNESAPRVTLVCDDEAAVLALSPCRTTVVTAIHNFQAAVLCKPSLQEPLCLLTTLSAKLGKDHQRRSLAYS